MPGVRRLGAEKAVDFLRPLVERDGLRSVLLFAVTDADKTPDGGVGASPRNPVLSALRRLRGAFPSLLLACDVCLCPYTDHGHCGVLGDGGFVDNAASLEMIARISRGFVEAGADVLAPSDMMDGRVRAIKLMLKEIGYLNRASNYTGLQFTSGFGSNHDYLISPSVPTYFFIRCP